MTKILIMGASGNVGSSVAKYLNRMNINYVKALRNPQANSDNPSNVDIRIFDLEDPKTFEEALAGIKSVFLVRPPKLTDVEGIFMPFINYCKSIHVEHIVFLSLLGIEKNPFPPHHKIEKLIIASGISYTFIRPSFFMQNLISPHGDDIKNRDEIYIPSGKALISFIDTEDIGEIIGKVLTEDGHLNKAYSVTGPEAINYYTVADKMTSILGRKINYSNPSLLKFRKTMIKRGILKEYATVMTILYLTTKLGMAKQVTSVAEKILGRKPHSISEFIKTNKDSWI